MNSPDNIGDPVWWEVVPGAARRAIDTKRRRFWGMQSLIFYRDTDNLWSSRWVPSNELMPRE
ncbi:MAG TPA: hypothetical protein VGK47_07785 [Nitrososphaeraceae archaeon]